MPAWTGPIACLVITGLAFLLAGPVAAAFCGLAASAAYAADLARLGRRNDRLEHLAHTDHLTRLANSRALWRDLTDLLEHRTVALVLADFDRFKEVNDEFGHATGDAVLRAFGDVAPAVVAADARWYRYGGEEFVLIVPDADEQQASDLAERVRSRVAQGLGGGLPELTVSAGIAAAAPGCPAHRLLDRADGALRHAKAMGRDRVVRASVIGESTADTATAAARRAALAMAAAALEARDPDTADHSDDVVVLCEALADRLGIDGDDREHLKVAASLHDVGKVAVPHHILNKPGPLDDDEWEVMRQHTITGEQILRSVPELEPVAPLVRSAHERYDGMGYPDGLAGDDIPLGSRVILCADAYHAIRSDRPYRAGRPAEEAVAEITANAGTQFDPVVAMTLADVVREANRPGGPRRRIINNSPRLMALLACAAVGGTSYAAVPQIREELGKLVGNDPPARTAPSELTRSISTCAALAASGQRCGGGAAPGTAPSGSETTTTTGTRERRPGATTPSRPAKPRRSRGGAAAAPQPGAGTSSDAAPNAAGTPAQDIGSPGPSSESEGVTLVPSGTSGGSETQSSTPGRSDDTPGNSGSAPGRSDDAPGNSGSAPGQSDSAPGQSGSAPGQSGENPGHGGEPPGQSGSAPGQSGNAPGQSESPPGQSGESPGNSGSAPGQSDDAPGRSGDAPGQGNGNGNDAAGSGPPATPPGQGGGNPGQGSGPPSTPPGQGGSNPGQGKGPKGR